MQSRSIVDLDLWLFYQNTQNQLNFLVLYITKFRKILSYHSLEMMARLAWAIFHTACTLIGFGRPYLQVWNSGRCRWPIGLHVSRYMSNMANSLLMFDLLSKTEPPRILATIGIFGARTKYLFAMKVNLSFVTAAYLNDCKP